MKMGADFNEMERVSKSLKRISENYMVLYNKMYKDVAMTSEAWEGDDQLAYVDQINGFCDELKAMAEQINLASETLEQQKTNYIEHIADNVSQIKKATN